MTDLEKSRNLRTALMMICPRGLGLEKHVDGIALTAKDFADGKAQLIALYEKRMGNAPSGKRELRMKDISNKELAAAFCGKEN